MTYYDNRKMFYGAKPIIFERARWLRNNLTSHEKKLWKELKTHFQYIRFKKQHPIGNFVADFYCYKLKLVVEIDGPRHNNKLQKVKNSERDHFMTKNGINVLRFTNNQIDCEIGQVLIDIKDFAA